MRATISTFVSLLVLLNIAPPAALTALTLHKKTRSLSNQLQKRDISCDPADGEGIRLGDCMQAVQRMPFLVGPIAGRRVTDRHNFTYSATGLYSAPQFYSQGTCTILIELDEPNPDVQSDDEILVEASWADVHSYVLDLIHRCVTLTHGLGGNNHVAGFAIFLRNEWSMAPEDLGPFRACLLTDYEHIEHVERYRESWIKTGGFRHPPRRTGSETS